MKKNKPNFFIIGAPKCGTTALAKYLSEHKEIFMSEPKEPHYFATDIENYRSINTKENYENLFSGVDNEKVIGEASVFYLYSKEALKNIKEFNPDSKILIMIRNPVEMVPSLHSQVIYSGDENILDFTEAWESNIDRKKLKKITENTRDAQILFYDEIAKYNEQILRVKDSFPAEQVKVIFFEDFKKNCQKVYEDTLSFIGVEQDGRIDFPKINENKKLKSVKLNTTIKRIPKPIKATYTFMKSILGIKSGLGLTKKINKYNTLIEKRETLSDEIKNSIINNYREDVEKLEKSFNRDLSSWLK